MSPASDRRVQRRWMPTFLLASGCFVLTFAACGETGVNPVAEPEEWILFLSTRDGATDDLGQPLTDIYRMTPAGTGVENLTKQPARHWNLSPSPDGGSVAFASYPCDIWTMKTDGTERVRLTDYYAGEGCNARPRWSPDGTLIAFGSNRERREWGTTRGVYDVYVMEADGSNPRNVSHSLGEALAFNVRVVGWSPDEQVVFETDAGGGVDVRVYVVNADGTGMRPLFDRAGDHSPAWSPDGSRVAFISDRDGRERLYVMNADGSGARPLTDHPGNDRLPIGPTGFSAIDVEYDPWSPDGTRIGFERFASGYWGVVHVVSADGSGLRQLTDEVRMFNGWSPDGTRILVSSLRDVFMVYADGTGAANLTNTPYEDTDALWMPRR